MSGDTPLSATPKEEEVTPENAARFYGNPAPAKIKIVTQSECDAMCAATRSSALEEAAKIADEFAENRRIAQGCHLALTPLTVDGERLAWGHGEARVCADNIAAAIRERAKK